MKQREGETELGPAEVVEKSPDPVNLPGSRPHFIGIGGAGQSALARILLARRLPVSGSDMKASAVTAALEEEGATVYIGHDAANVRGADWVIATDAADPETNPELQEAIRREIPVWRRSELLGELMPARTGIAVTGTHGKTTTTAMLGAILEAVGLDPMVVVGAEVRSYGSNVRLGEGEWFVAEACEAYDAMHDMNPRVIILTNLEADHLDHHGTVEKLEESVRRFVQKLPADGLLVYPADDPRCARIAAAALCEKATFEAAELELSVPGRHNVLNAQAALAVAAWLGVDLDAAQLALKAFPGVERRLEVVGEWNGIILIDDYAHHPTEVTASISALHEQYPGRRVVVAFQPHLYSRTRDLLPAFADALSAADVVILTDIYPAREEPIPGVGSARIAERLETAHPELSVLYVPALTDVAKTVARSLRTGDVFVAMGAGDINDVLRDLPPLLERRQSKKDRIVVLSGGSSAEREVSRLSGRLVSQALRQRGYKVQELDPSLSLHAVLESNADAAFIALHGTSGEDGRIQGLLELAGIPYTGSGVLSSTLAMDKAKAKEVLTSQGIPVPRGICIARADWESHLAGAPLPAVVKPNAQGSSIGLRFCSTEEELKEAVQVALHYDSSVLIEPWLKGVELSACILGNDDPQVLPLVEIAPKGRASYDYEAKYTPGLTDEIVPARVSAEVEAEAKRLGMLSHLALGCLGFSRVDLMATHEGVFVLEVNTVPGLTGTSIFPRSADAAGIPFVDLCDRLVHLAWEAHEARRPTF